MQKPWVKKVITAAAVIVVLAAAWFLFLRPSVRFTEDKPVIERHELRYAMDMVAKTNGTVIPEAEKLDTEVPGEYKLTYRVEKWIFHRNVVLTYEVVDTTPPVITIRHSAVELSPMERFTAEDMRNNVSVNEGGFEIESDYDPSGIGNFTVKVKAVDDYENASEASYKILVEDKESPFIFRTPRHITLLTGEELVIRDYISYGDDGDPDPVVKVEGKLDTNKAGVYPVTVSVTDASGNRKAWGITVEVLDQFPEEEPSDEPEEEEEEPYYYDFDKMMKDYAGKGRKFGIDVSEWQGDINFDAVKKAGCEFVILRVGWSHKGIFTADELFQQNLARAKEAGIPVGIYLFCYDFKEEDLRASIDQMFEELGDNSLELPIVFDWENFWSYQDYRISFRTLNHFYDIFEEEVTKRGYESMVYGSQYYLESAWAHLDQRSVWLAQYSEKPELNCDFAIWQLSDQGRIPGIGGYVDLNIMFTEPYKE